MPKRYRIILAVGVSLVAFLAAYFASTPRAHREGPEVEFDDRTADAEVQAEPESVPENLDSPPEDPGAQLEPAESEQSPLPPGFRIHLVRENETMRSIAQEVYGDESAWTLIAHENPFEDPIRLIAGTELRLPPLDHERPGEPEEVAELPQAPIVHVVKKNETLGHIAVLYYGKASKWERIFEANRDKLSSPDMVRAGMKLTIPPDFEDD